MGEKHRNIQWKDLNSTFTSSSFTDRYFTHRLGGTVWEGVKTGGTRGQQERRMHINELELLALQLALETFLKVQEIESLLIQMYNIVALTYFLKMGRHKKFTNGLSFQTNLGTAIKEKSNCDRRVPSQDTEQACRHRIPSQDKFLEWKLAPSVSKDFV